MSVVEYQGSIREDLALVQCLGSQTEKDQGGASLQARMGVMEKLDSQHEGLESPRHQMDSAYYRNLGSPLLLRAAAYLENGL